VFRQRLVHRERGCTITLMERTPLPAPVHAAGMSILEPDAPVVWFTFENAWHDIGRFHTAAGEFTGFYANILTPVRFLSPLEWETTDLCLDVWHSADGTLLLDEDELDEAASCGWLAPETAAAARREAERLLRLAERGEWPPAIVHEWPLARAAQVVAGGTPHDDVV
jgi:predicted RNA-binding protein associated with RNAse of E/G family